MQLKEQLHLNSFYDLMPDWFVIVGVIIATSAAIIASQAMIAGSFTLIGEALRLSLWPKMKVKYPSEAKGQLFIPAMNLLMFLGCAGSSSVFQGIIQNGSSIWFGNYYYHDRHHHSVCQFYGTAPGKGLLDLCFSYFLSNN